MSTTPPRAAPVYASPVPPVGAREGSRGLCPRRQTSSLVLLDALFARMSVFRVLSTFFAVQKFSETALLIRHDRPLRTHPSDSPGPNSEPRQLENNVLKPLRRGGRDSGPKLRIYPWLQHTGTRSAMGRDPEKEYSTSISAKTE